MKLPERPDTLLREPTRDDYKAIRAQWLSAYWDRYAEGRHIPKAVFYTEHGQLVDRLLVECPAVVAYLEPVPDEILGWAVYTSETLHYAYVKHIYRRRGLATGLLLHINTLPEHRLTCFSHGVTAPGRNLADKFGLHFNPYKTFQ